MSQNKTINIILGKLCSGKTTFADNNYYNYYNIDISQIVKSIKNNNYRIHDETLDQQIIQQLQIILQLQNNINIIGIRQLSILLSIIKQYQCNIILLYVPDDIRKQRYIKRKSSKDKLSFEAYDELDDKLGYNQLINYLKINNIKYKTINNF